MISNAQKAVLHIAKSQLRLDDDAYRAILRAQANVESSADLSNKGFDEVMRRFEELGFKNTSRRRWTTPKPAGNVTPAQLDLIRTLYDQLGLHEMARQMGFNKRCCRKSWPQTRSDAIKVTEALKKMIAEGRTFQNKLAK